jgi:hypothetical protein
MSAVLTVRISENEKAAIERAAVSGRSQSSLAAAAIGRYMREQAWLVEKVANARASRDLSESEVSAMFSALERE